MFTILSQMSPALIKGLKFWIDHVAIAVTLLASIWEALVSNPG
jgi:hypothetical protein